MKLTVVLLLLAAVSQAAEVNESSRSKQNVEEGAMTKRALAEGNPNVGKRASLLSTVAPSVTPGIEYADSKESQLDKSPAQQIYATPVPQIAKISDVLTGQGPPFQTAIASHLYAPISVYQPRISSPTTFEVSPPIQSQLAYSENLPFQPNAIQYTPHVFKQPQKQALAKLTLQQPQQILVQPVYQQQAQLNPQQIYQQIPNGYQTQLAYNQNQVQIPHPQRFQVAYPQNQLAYAHNQVVYPQNQLVYAPNQVVYPQNHVAYTQNQIAYPQNQLIYPQNQAVYGQKLVQVPNVQLANVYEKQEAQRVQNQQPIQRELKTVQPVIVKPEKQITIQQQNYNAKPQGAVSYASFSQSQPSPSIEQRTKQTQYQTQAQSYHQPQFQKQVQPLYQIQPQPPQTHVQYQSESQNQAQSQTQPQIQAQQYQVHVQPQFQIHTQPQYQVQAQPQYQVHSQPQLQIQPQYVSAKLEPSPANSISAPVTTPTLDAGRLAFYRTNPFQQQLLQPQLYSGQDAVLQNPGYGTVVATPTFPPVQYFGKFAQTIFGGYQN